MCPLYDFECPDCYKINKDIMVKLTEKPTFKKVCESCGSEMKQKVAALNFELKGVGWFRNSESGEGYNITEMEIRKNLDTEKKIEDLANDKMSKPE